MQEQREAEDLGRAQLLEQRRRTACVRRVGRIPQRLETADRQQRVLVDRVLVVEVADDAVVNRRELRQDPVQQPAVVHLGQARVDARARVEQGAQLLTLGLGAGEVVGAVAIEVLLDAVERLLRDRAAVGKRQPEDLEPQRGAVPGAARHRRSGCRRRQSRNCRPTRVTPARSAGGLAARCDAAELAGNGAGVLEVVAHQRLDPLPRAVALAAEGVGDALLELVGQHVGVAAGLGVQDAADLQQEILGVAAAVPAARARSPSLRSPPSVCR